MTEAILIAGLPGSGKTYLGKKLSSETGYLFIDDASKAFGASRAEALSALQKLKGISGVIIADPLLCYEGSIENAKELLKEALDVERVRLICFKNEPGACLENVKRRDDGRAVSQLIAQLSLTWKPESFKDCELRSVYSGSRKD